MPSSSAPDAGGKVTGFIGGAESDYSALGKAPDDFAILSDGKLLVLRGGAFERYTGR